MKDYGIDVEIRAAEIAALWIANFGYVPGGVGASGVTASEQMGWRLVSKVNWGAPHGLLDDPEVQAGWLACHICLAHTGHDEDPGVR